MGFTLTSGTERCEIIGDTDEISERVAMYSLIGAVLCTWRKVEDGLLNFALAAFSAESRSVEGILTILLEIRDFDDRARAVNEFMLRTYHKEEFSPYLKNLSREIDVLRKASRKRNKVAHGQVINSKSGIYFVPFHSTAKMVREDFLRSIGRFSSKVPVSERWPIEKFSEIYTEIEKALDVTIKMLHDLKSFVAENEKLIKSMTRIRPDMPFLYSDDDLVQVKIQTENLGG